MRPRPRQRARLRPAPLAYWRQVLVGAQRVGPSGRVGRAHLARRFPPTIVRSGLLLHAYLADVLRRPARQGWIIFSATPPPSDRKVGQRQRALGGPPQPGKR